MIESKKLNTWIEQQSALKRKYKKARKRDEKAARARKKYIDRISVPDLTSFDTVGRLKQYGLSME